MPLRAGKAGGRPVPFVRRGVGQFSLAYPARGATHVLAGLPRVATLPSLIDGPGDTACRAIGLRGILEMFSSLKL